MLALAAASSLCVYFDQKLILIQLICYLSFIFSNKSKKSKMILTIYYLFLSLPFLYLISIWGNITPSSDAEERKILKNFNFHHLGYVLTIVSFYFFPFLLFLDNLKSKVKEVFNKKNIIIFLFFFLFLIFFIFFHDLNSEYYNGGGAIKKLIQLFFTNILIQKILLVLFFIICFLIIMIFEIKTILTISSYFF